MAPTLGKLLAVLREDEASEPPKPAPVSGPYDSVNLKDQQAYQESSAEKQESQAQSQTGATELPDNDTEVAQSLLDLRLIEKQESKAESPAGANELPVNKAVNAEMLLDLQLTEKQESQAESPAGAKELPVNEAKVSESLLDLQQKVSSVSENPSTNSVSATENEPTSTDKGSDPLENEASKSIENSPDYIVIDPSLAPKEKESPKASGSSKNASPKSEEESSISHSPEKGEAPEPKTKKSVKMKRNENELVFENPSVPKIATLKPCPSVGMSLENYDLIKDNSPAFKSNGGNGESSAMVEEAWEMLKKSYVYFKGKEVGTLAAMDPSAEALNYNQVYKMCISSFL